MPFTTRYFNLPNLPNIRVTINVIFEEIMIDINERKYKNI